MDSSTEQGAVIQEQETVEGYDPIVSDYLDYVLGQNGDVVEKPKEPQAVVEKA
jgi:hypothetical protein